MALPRGLTGFYGAGESPPAEIDVAEFRRRCFEAARTLGGRVVSKEEPTAVGANYRAIAFELPQGSAVALLNRYFPIVGFVSRSSLPLRFIDCEGLAELLSADGAYQALSRAELERPIEKEDLRLLSDAEVSQIEYWRPERVGDVIFNGWD